LIDIYQKTYSTLTGLGYPVREQGSYGPNDTPPATLVTYLVQDQTDRSHADNLPTSTTTSVQVAIYSRSPAIVQQADGLLRAAMIPAGFLRAGGRNVPLDADTGHYGYISTYNFYDSEG
jgi:hypothetical protein